MNPLFNAHIELREIIARHRSYRTPFTPLECFAYLGIERLVDAVPVASQGVPQTLGEPNER